MAADDTNTYHLYTNTEYWSRLTRLIQVTKSGDRVLLTSMLLEPTEPEIAGILREVERAASRGVHVSLAIDAHSFLIDFPNHLPGPMWYRRSMPRLMPRQFRNKLQIMEIINAYPTGHADIINLPTASLSLPISGRSHIKAAIVNNHVFLGGCNLGLSHSVDIMVGWKDKMMSDRLYKIFESVIHNKHAGRALSWVDRSLAVSPDTTIYIDSGLRGQSIIFEEASALIDSAEKWIVMTCQYFPNSITAKRLMAAAERGVKIELIYAHPRHHGLIGGLGQHISILRERARVPKELFRHALGRKDPMLHAKLIACDKGVMLGSHNYVKAGVALGTAEIALKSSDAKLARAAVETLHRGLGRKSKTT